MEEKALLARLAELSQGLLYQSEMDFPFMVIDWSDKTIEPLTIEKVGLLAGQPADVAMAEISLAEFFHHSVTPQSWHKEKEQARVKRYCLLQDFLLKELQNIRVFRFGSVEIDIYLLGQTVDKHYIGLTTKAIET